FILLINLLPYSQAQEYILNITIFVIFTGAWMLPKNFIYVIFGLFGLALLLLPFIGIHTF
ncbi:hypothetical protein ACJX0J_032804, partial [Zea mays]